MTCVSYDEYDEGCTLKWNARCNGQERDCPYFSEIIELPENDGTELI